MASPVAAYIQAASEGANLGSLVRAQRRTIGANIVDAQAASVSSFCEIRGIYSFDTGTPSAVTNAGQDGTTTAYFWFANPIGNTRNARLRRLSVKITALTTGATSHATAPFISLARGTFTGTFSGASVTAVKRKSADATETCDAYTAVTGATVTLGDKIWAAMCFGIEPLTADILNNAVECVWNPLFPDDYIVVAPGECLIAYQSEAGTASDLRVVQFSGTWCEVDA